ncbi:MAG TPA: type VI secretion system tip protein VgrG [Thermoanaerobaculia bacterium]|jgi:Rhs element Vgr protein
MSAPSPIVPGAMLVSTAITVNGSPIDDAIQVDSIDTWVAINRIPRARLAIFDGSPSAADFPISNEKTFIPGSKVKIAAGYDGSYTTVFDGVVVRQGVSIDQSNASKLIVDLAGNAIKMTLERNNAVFPGKTDSAVIKQLISDNGLTGDVGSTSTTYEEIVQYYAADWDLMVMRAELNGMVAIADGDTVTVKKPDTSQSPVLRVAYGETVLDLDLQMDAATQYSSSAIQSSSWEPDQQKVIEATPGSVTVTEAGNISSATLAGVFNVKKFPLVTGGALAQDALQDWSAGELLKSKLAKIRGTVRFQGSAKAQVGKMLEVDGAGNRFNGNFFISGVRHRIADGAWLTTAEVGLSSQWFVSEAPEITAPPAAGQLPAICGLQTGVVKAIATDPNGDFRVQISLPLLQSQTNVWARLATFYASNGFGAFFYPEVNDEVIVGFMNDDPRYPVILGSVYGKAIAPAVTPAEANDTKQLLTRSKLVINLDDKDKVIEIKTPGGQSVTLSDKATSIKLQDSNGNSVELSSGGVTIDSASSVKILAKANVAISAGANLSMSAEADATLDGLQIQQTAKTKFAASGSLTSEVTSGGILTLQGTLVKIN